MLKELDRRERDSEAYIRLLQLYRPACGDGARNPEFLLAGMVGKGQVVGVRAIWDRMQFASHLRTQRLGEFTVGSDLHRRVAQEQVRVELAGVW